MIISLFLSHKVAIPAVSCLLSGRVASGLRDLTYLIMLGSWTAETGSVEPPIQRARNLSDLSCFSLDQSSTSSFNVKSNIYNFSSENYLSLPLLGDRCAAPAKLSSREVEIVDSGLGGVIRASAADLEQQGELDPPWESTNFWRALSNWWSSCREISGRTA